MKFIQVKVTTKAKSEGVEEISPDMYKVRTTEAPEKGKANARVTELLSKHLNIPRYKIYLKSGQTSRDKIFVIED